MKPVISILTPTYNHERYIHECIESVLNQTYPNWEMIIMDDGSTDGTPSVVSRYNDTRITYVRKDHQGIDKLGESYNEALQRSKGELILILEGDDYIPTDRLEKQWSTFQEEQVVLSHGKYGYVLGDKLIVYPSLFRLDDLRNRPIGSALKIFLQGFNPIGTQSVMIRKSSLLKIGGFVQPTYLPLVDYPTWMRLALIGTFEYIPELLGYWRRHPFSITINHNEQILNGFIKYCDEFVLSYGASFKNLHLMRSVENRGTLAYLALAWSHLSQRNWEKALRFAQESWGRRTTVNWSFQAKMILTLLSSHLHLDLPGALKKTRQSLYEHGTTRH